jgi:hypothetical protein
MGTEAGVAAEFAGSVAGGDVATVVAVAAGAIVVMGVLMAGGGAGGSEPAAHALLSEPRMMRAVMRTCLLIFIGLLLINCACMLTHAYHRGGAERRRSGSRRF